MAGTLVASGVFAPGRYECHSNGRELIRVRDVHKTMGWQHSLGWTTVMIVNLLSQSGHRLDGPRTTQVGQCG